MNYIRIISVLIIIVISISVNAQNVEFDKKNFKDKKGFKEAISNLREGDNHYSQGRTRMCQNALVFYSKAYDFNPENALLNYKMGNCYLKTNPSLAVMHLEKAEKLSVIKKTELYLMLAKAYHYNYQWDNAIVNYNLYLNKLDEFREGFQTNEEYKPIIQKRIEECRNGKELTAEPVDVNIQNLGSTINSDFTDYSPLVFPDESTLVFTSRRKEVTGGAIDLQQFEYFEDIFISQKRGDQWGQPEIFGPVLNTSAHDATVSISHDGNILFIYKGQTGEGDIYESNKVNGEWSYPKPLSINTDNHESSACLSLDGNTMYVVTDRNGDNIGGRDIFVSKKDETGEWGEIVNLGNVVNTPYDEEGVFMHPDGKTLFFSSKGHNSMGGYDIFKTKLKRNGQWGKPENLGYPINSPFNDTYMMIIERENQEIGYYSSARAGGQGESDIYMAIFPEVIDTLSLALDLGQIEDEVDESTEIIEDDEYVPMSGEDEKRLIEQMQNIIEEEIIEQQKEEVAIVAEVEQTDILAESVEEEQKIIGVEEIKTVKEEPVDTIVEEEQPVMEERQLIEDIIKEEIVQEAVVSVVDETKVAEPQEAKMEETEQLKTELLQEELTAEIAEVTEEVLQETYDDLVLESVEEGSSEVEVMVEEQPTIEVVQPMEIEEEVAVVEETTEELVSEPFREESVDVEEKAKKYTTVGGAVKKAYRVQIAASKTSLSEEELKQRYQGNMEVEEIRHDGWCKYLIGNFTLFSEAKKIKESCGVPDSWVVASKLIFRVQVAASKTPLTQQKLKNRYSGSMKVDETCQNGWYKYLIGNFANYEDARQLKEGCGVYDAWVVVNKNGERISINKAIDLK